MVHPKKTGKKPPASIILYGEIVKDFLFEIRHKTTKNITTFWES